VLASRPESRPPLKRPRQLALWPTARTAAEQVFNGRAALAIQLRTVRKRRRLTQESLAERAGMDRSYLSGIERGRHNVPLDTICRLAWALGMDVRELLLVGPPVARRRRASRPASE
jgi:DNA-binding XRE family transcriptional regulator